MKTSTITDTTLYSSSLHLGKPFPVPSVFQMPVPRLHKATEQNHRLVRPATASIVEGARIYLSHAPQAARLDAATTTTNPDPHVCVSLDACQVTYYRTGFSEDCR